jgi:polysaccharide biosynthesis protein PslG
VLGGPAATALRCRLAPARALALAAAALLAALALAAPAQAAQVGAVTDITWGQPRASVDREVDLLKAAGVRWVRANVNWRGLEPDRKGSINPWLLADYDYAVDRARAAGMEVLMPISDGVPYWASADPHKYLDPGGGRHWDGSYRPRSMADYGDIARFVAEHFSKRGVHAYEIWNEPNLTWFWPSGPNPSEYVEMLRAGSQAVRAADPAATVVMGGLSKSDFSYLEGVYRAGGGPYFDAVAVHPYTYGMDPTVAWKGTNPGEDPNRISLNAFPAIKEVHRTMEQFGDASKQLWLTEFGYSTTTQRGGVSEARQADYLEKAYRYVEQFPWVHSLFWFSARNTPWRSDADDYEARFGLMTTDWRLKPSYGALRAYAVVEGLASGSPVRGLTSRAPYADLSRDFGMTWPSAGRMPWELP